MKLIKEQKEDLIGKALKAKDPALADHRHHRRGRRNH